MHLAVALFKSSIGRKILMAVTGLLLLVWVTAHLIGNLHIFGAPDEINGYAHFLQSLGPLLWVARIGLLGLVLVHIWAAVVLTLENQNARPEGYTFKHTLRATAASRAMRVSGVVVLAFIIYHLLHFTIGVDHAAFVGDAFKSNHEYVLQHDFHLAGVLLVTGGTHVHDVHQMVVRSFQHPVVSVAYIVAVGLLAFHLWHGIESAFQTLGLRTSRWLGGLSLVARAYCLLYFAGNLAIPGAILAGVVKPHEGTPATHAQVVPVAQPLSGSAP